MRKTPLLLITVFFMAVNCKAQIYIEPVLGYEIDLNNNSRFKQINSSVQFSFKQSNSYELIVQLQKTFPVSWSGSDSSFTFNSNLPVYAAANKTIHPSSYSISLGHRLKVMGATTNNTLSIVLYTGIIFQKFSVQYEYDKSNYIILNPDKDLHPWGAFLKGGLEYMRQIKAGRLFFQVTVATPPIRRSIKYPSSFGYMAPLALNVGYSFIISKEHEKQ